MRWRSRVQIRANEVSVDRTGRAELDNFLERYPSIQMLEVLMPDMNGIFRCKRIHRSEFAALFAGSLKCPATQSLVTTMGEYDHQVDPRLVAGEPDNKVLPVSGSLAPVPWLASPTGQVLASHYTPGDEPAWVDPRHVLAGVLERFVAMGLRPVIATELEFYLVSPGDGVVPKPLLGRIPGTAMEQQGIQFALAEDMWQYDAFLDAVRIACEQQSVPMTTMLSEFAPGQWEINTRHVDDPLLACDHALLLKRIVKGVALQQGLSATFMAKPFAASAGSGLHIHASLYDGNGNNVFSDPASAATPALSPLCRHAVGGLVATMSEAMALFAPNANSYRRFVPGTYAPLAPSWGYNHRDVSLRIPVSGHDNRRIEHRVAGADANPYLVAAAVLAGMHHGITSRCDPGPMVAEGTDLPAQVQSLPSHWEAALARFDRSTLLPRYLGAAYCSAFGSMRRAECEAFRACIPNLDYEWYLRAV
ncbi:MAG: glutamine synthetase [Halioglobus sp.]|nr:glutamine synthetase [Halioglobus sp.]MCB1709033.1 glutamine synthetase [Halioglobus sp.]MCP5121926.1 glutamine synthetase [Pseudomonadales bacterium]MCP5192535.1 glutamine synthetase [Pseudomonadales bacterium]